MLCELLFDHNILIQIKKYRMLILRFTLNDKKAQRYLMGGIEQVIALHKDQLMAKVPIILKVLYDLDVLSETAIIEWSEKVRKINSLLDFIAIFCLLFNLKIKLILLDNLTSKEFKNMDEMKNILFTGIKEIYLKGNQSRHTRQGRSFHKVAERSRRGRE